MNITTDQKFKNTREYYNTPEVHQHIKEYSQRPDVMERRRQNEKQQRLTNIHYRLTKNLRCRLNEALHRNSKSDHTMQLIGCTIGFLKDWLEFQFYDNMEWSNYGVHFHIDHVTPCNTFNLEDPEEQRKCFNWSNLAPLRADKNISKRDKIDPFQIMLQELKSKVFLKLMCNQNNIDYSSSSIYCSSVS